MKKKKSKEFQQLIELTDIINRYKTRDVEVITSPTDTSNRYRQFYDALTSGEIDNDSAAAAIFNIDEKDRKYRRLRQGLKDRLLNTVFFVDPSDTNISTLKSAFYECTKEYALLNILYARGARITAFEIGKNLIDKAIKYDFIEIIAGTAQMLKVYYSLIPKESEKVEEYEKIAIEHLEKYKQVILTQGYYQQAIRQFANSKSPKPEIKKEIEVYIKKVKKVPENHRSRIFMLYFHMLHVMNEMVTFNWGETVKECNRGIEYFESKGIKNEQRSFLLQKSMAEIMLMRYADAEVSTEKCIELTPKGSGNWFKALELKVLLYLHSGQYDKAFELNNEVIVHTRFDSIRETDQETWKIFEAYLYWLGSLEKISVDVLSQSKVKKFRLSKFMNETPQFSKDKRGMNIPLLILHFLFLLKEERFDEAMERIESIMKYYQRHLKQDDENFRTNCFLKMLESIVKANFDLEKTKTKANKHIENLKSKPINLFNQAREIEVLPYEQLWSICLTCLK